MSYSMGQFSTEINTINNILSWLKFLEERNYFPDKISDVSKIRHLSTYDLYKYYINNSIYTFILLDNSLLNFIVDQKSGILNYSYIQCPLLAMHLDEYVRNQGSEFKESMLFDEDLLGLYQIYLQDCEIRSDSVTIRYDYECLAYFEGLHPASHIHIGRKNNIRIGSNKILSPMSFFNFVIRQCYPALWKHLNVNHLWQNAYKGEKPALLKVNSSYWNPLDAAEFFLE